MVQVKSKNGKSYFIVNGNYFVIDFDYLVDGDIITVWSVINSDIQFSDKFENWRDEDNNPFTSIEQLMEGLSDQSTSTQLDQLIELTANGGGSVDPTFKMTPIIVEDEGFPFVLNPEEYKALVLSIPEDESVDYDGVTLEGPLDITVNGNGVQTAESFTLSNPNTTPSKIVIFTYK